jgi:23S rRNA (guanine745-N1)-methyltransferase
VIDSVANWLACPNCGSPLSRSGAALRCPAGHGFDIARQGYVSLLPPGARAAAGDSQAMVAARAAFLAAGHYAGLAAALAGAAVSSAAAVPSAPAGPAGGAVPDDRPGCVLDVGAGTGYYLAAVLDRLPGREGLALDASKYAARRAARAHPRIGAVTADAWRRLPVTDGAAALALNVFAPRNGAELWRVLRPGGRLLVVTPGPGHLAELTGPLGLLAVDPRKEERLAATLGPWFDLAGQQPVGATLALDHPAVAAAAGMGPGARHVSEADLAARIALLPAVVPVTLSVALSEFRRRDTWRQ